MNQIKNKLNYWKVKLVKLQLLHKNKKIRDQKFKHK